MQNTFVPHIHIKISDSLCNKTLLVSHYAQSVHLVGSKTVLSSNSSPPECPTYGSSDWILIHEILQNNTGDNTMFAIQVQG